LVEGNMAEETVRCARCGGDNPADAQFCIECGKPLTTPTTGPTTRLAGSACPACGANNPENARFCVVCGRSLAGTPEPQPQPAQRPWATPPQPAPRQSYPRVQTPAPFIPARPMTPRPRPSRSSGLDAGGLVFIIGLFVLLISHLIWPGILLLIGITIMVNQSRHGQPEKGVIPLIWLGGLTLLIMTGSFWPGILILWFVSMAAGGWGRGRHWHW
jgi:hypothetical protein